MCQNDCHCFPDLEPSQYYAHKDDTCPVCQAKRFNVVVTPSGTRVTPVKVMYWRGLGTVIKDMMFTNPSFCSLRGTGRQEYFYTSKECARLHEKAKCSLADKATSVYEVGLDWGQPFVNKVHSCGFIMVR